MSEAAKTFLVSLWSKKFAAFVALEITLLSNGQWNEAVIAFLGYCGVEVVDKKTVTVPKPESDVSGDA